MGYQSVNPFDNKLTSSFNEITDKQLEQKLAAATACFRHLEAHHLCAARCDRE